MVADHPPAGFVKASVDCPDDEDLINALIDAAAAAGAGDQGHYSRVAMVLRGYGTWRSDLGAAPHIGAVGEISVEPSVRIEMRCREDRIAAVVGVWRLVHPFEEPVIEVVALVTTGDA